MDMNIIYVILIALAVILALMGLGLVNMRQWLLYGVTEAEAALGGGTGQIKLRMVYDMAVTRFGWLAKVIPFNLFSQLVDLALVQMRELLETNQAVAALVSEGYADEG